MSQNQSDSDILKQFTVTQLIGALELLPDVLFWIKDANSRVVFANRVFMEHLGFKQLEQVLGKNDYDFSPPHIAKQFINDDKKVMNGELVTDRLELNLNQNGEFGWFSTSKRPLLDDESNIIGTYGLTRHMEKTSQTLSHLEAISLPVTHIKAHFHRQITLEELAEIAHLSVSALERRFKKFLKKTPNQFINEVRLENARKLLIETQTPIAQIAHDCGFPEPSYFSKRFRKLFGELPKQTRLKVNRS